MCSLANFTNNGPFLFLYSQNFVNATPTTLLKGFGSNLSAKDALWCFGYDWHTSIAVWVTWLLSVLTQVTTYPSGRVEYFFVCMFS